MMPDDNQSLSAIHWVWSAVCTLVVLATVALRYALPVRDGDLWFHMLYGKYFFEHKTLIVDHTIFSWTPATNDTIYCTWVPDIFLFLLHKAAGLPGLFAFRYACLYFFVLACFLFARRLLAAANPLVWLIILIGVLMSYVAAYIKPEIVSFALMTLLVWIWWRIRTDGSRARRWCYAIPAVMLIWVNSHGAFVFGYIFIATVAVGEIMNTWWSDGNQLPQTVRRHLWMALGISLLVPLVNPYGWHYTGQLFWSLIPTEANLAYNRSVFAYTPTFKQITPFHAFSLYGDLAILILAFLYFANLKNKKNEWSSLLSNLVFALLYTLYFRTTFFWAPVFAFSAITLLSGLEGKLRRFSLKATYTISSLALLTILWLSVNAVYAGYTKPERYVQAGHFGISFANAVDCAEYIKQNFPNARIGNTYGNGAYLLWRLWPKAKVLIDPRHFPYKNWSDEYMAFHNGNRFSSFLRNHQADIWCVGNDSIDLYSHFFYSPDWKLAFYGRGASVFVPASYTRSGGRFFEVAPDILETDNRFVFSTVFLFALKSRDWKTVDSLIAKITTSFNQPRNNTLLSETKTVLSGMQAFLQKDYPKAIALLGQNPQPFKIEIAVSHLQLAQSFMTAHQFTQAWQHVQEALKKDPGSISNYFNAGILDWVLYESYPGHRSDLVKQSLTRKLNYFIENAHNDPDLDAYVKTARKIVSGEYRKIQTLPLLIIPQYHALTGRAAS